MLGNGIPMVTTALALSSVKSRPSLTFPLQTAISSAPSGTKTSTIHRVRDEQQEAEFIIWLKMKLVI